MNTRKYIAAITCAALLALPTAALADSTDVSLMVGDATISADEATGQPYINDAGRTMIPLRIVSESMGYATDWQPDGSIHITSADGTVDVTLQVGSANYTANGQAGTFETLPTLKNDRTYLPARDFTELYGQIYWDNDSRTVWIYNGDAPTYCVLGNSLLRATADGITSVAMPEGSEVSSFGKSDVIMQQRVINGVGYVAINYNNNHSQQCPLFRDDGDHMTKIATINGTSSFYVDGDTLYHTTGTSAGPWSDIIQPNILRVTTIGGDTKTYTLDFAVNTCTLDMVDDQLIATDSDGVQHVIDLESEK